MIFPFEITRQYKLPDIEFEDYSSSEVMNRISNYLCKESLILIKKEDNRIEFKGNKSFLKYYSGWFPFYRINNCIDKGIIKISDSSNGRKISYTFQIRNEFYRLLIIAILISWMGILIFRSLEMGLIIICMVFLVLIFEVFTLIVMHPPLSVPIERMRYETIRKRNKSIQQNLNKHI